MEGEILKITPKVGRVKILFLLFPVALTLNLHLETSSFFSYILHRHTFQIQVRWDISVQKNIVVEIYYL